MNRATEIWNGREMLVVRRLVRRLLALLIRTLGSLLGHLLWQLRLVWARISPRARIFLIIVGLVVVSMQTSSLAPSLSAIAHAVGVLLFAFVGFWLIVTAPFKRRRWWGGL